MLHRWSLPSRSPKQFDDQKYEETIDLIQQVVCSPGATCHFGKALKKLRNKTEIAALSASRRREKLTWQTKITLDDNSACSIQDYRN